MRRIIALCLLASLVLAGCTIAPKAKPKKDLTGTVRVLAIGAPGMETSLFSGFQMNNPNVKAETVVVPEELDFQQIVAQIKSGELKVDAIVAPGNSFLFSQEVVKPLDDMVKAENMPLDPYGDTLQFAKYKGKLMGLPVMVSPMVVAYNKELFQKVGLPMPAAGWTWADFDKAAEALAKAQPDKQKYFGVGIPPWSLVDLLLTAGKGPADPDLKPLQAQVERFARFQTNKWSAPNSLGAESGDYFSAFKSQDLGMVLGYWENSFGHSSPTFGWSVAPMPGTEKTPGVVTLAMITANAENKANAEAFVQYVGSAKGGAAVVRMPGAPVPAFVDEANQKDWLSHTKLGEDAAFMLKLKYLPTAEYPEEMAGLLLKEVDAVLGGKKSAADAIKAYQEARAPLMSKK